MFLLILAYFSGFFFGPPSAPLFSDILERGVLSEESEGCHWLLVNTMFKSSVESEVATQEGGTYTVCQGKVLETSFCPMPFFLGGGSSNPVWMGVGRPPAV